MLKVFILKLHLFFPVFTLKSLNHFKLKLYNLNVRFENGSIIYFYQ